LTPGMKAVTLRVSDIEGVAGFVLPGDRVDVMLTRIGERGGNGSSDIVLQNVKVLAIDQIADDRVDKPAVVKAVTLEVDTVDGQKLVLAGSSGTLSLALRKAGDLAVDPTRQITLDDLNKQQKKKDTKNSGFSTISVMRGNKKENYSVPAEQQPLTNSAVNQGVIQ
ncbi:MAG TPA: Flp pilus assembly protein CpaB, partial [Xanthobacteraceae bacterium]|nr:Flp pilus assembly protein CpaB [Xanthobacteraceae bacterium]